MSLACSCDHDFRPGDIGFYIKEYDFSVITENTQCSSCGKQIRTGDTGVKIDRFKVTNEYDDNEDKYKWAPFTPEYLCEHCGEIYLTLAEIGYGCIAPEDTLEAQREYWDLTEFDPKRYENK